jgi:predicted phosphohydrolase
MTMLIREFSDLHIEVDRGNGNDPWVPPVLETDKDTVLILAGDIDSKARITQYAESLADRFRYVLFVPGNHEYYGSYIDKDFSSDIDNVIWLNNTKIEIDDVIFFGATLWTDFNDGSYCSISEWHRYMSDAREIRGKGGKQKITPQDITKEHKYTIECIKEEITNKPADKKLCVITHHSPSFSNEEAKFIGGKGSGYFHSNLDYLVQEADKWIFGHTHYNIRRHGMHSNQRGYVGYEHTYGFDEEGFVKI